MVEEVLGHGATIVGVNGIVGSMFGVTSVVIENLRERLERLQALNTPTFVQVVSYRGEI